MGMRQLAPDGEKGKGKGAAATHHARAEAVRIHVSVWRRLSTDLLAALQMRVVLVVVVGEFHATVCIDLCM